MKEKTQNCFIAICLILICLSVPSVTFGASDTVAPAISGAVNKTVNINSSFNALSGVTAKDNVDGNITKNIKVSGTVNTKKAGNYKLSYSVSDKAKNKTAVTRTVTVKKDTVKPSISGASNKTVYINSSFNTLSGVTAKDNVDGNITKNIKVSGTVNTKKAGNYKLSYSVSDKAKNKTTVTRTITVKKDTVKPSISGALNKTVYTNSSFNALSGVTAKDNVDGNISKNIKVSGTVNMKKAGNYKLSYSVSDKAKNKTTVTRTITVKKDTVKPSISGASNKTVNINSSFSALSGVTAKDNVDGNITKNIKVSGTVNMKKAGNYKLIYTVSDKAKNTQTVTRTITILDNIKPKLSNIKDIQIKLGEKFIALEGISASDNNDGDITSAIKVDGSVNVKKAGSYVLKYSVTDKSGNTVSTNRTVTVIDTLKPVLSGIQDIQLNFGESFNALDDISASDNSDGDITSAIKVDGSVNVNKAGTYVLIYSVTDQSGNTVTANRVVTVVDTIKPIIIGAADTMIGLHSQFNLLDDVSASDNNDGDLTAKIETSGSVDSETEGNYLVTYKVTDAAGNTAEISRTITVQKIAVTGVSITAPTSMKTGVSQQVAAIISPKNATNQQISWHSSDETVASIDENGVLKTLSEGKVTITATVDGVSTSKTLTISDRPNLYLYKSGSATINNLIKSLSINIYNYESNESVFIEKVEIFENDSLYSTYTAEKLENSGINTTIAPYSSWGMTLNFKVGIWANQSKVVVTIRTENDKSYQYSIDI
ncbi:immunoglobulin-like domain-containing protein [Peribacillus phoenicis]|uniref:immunoglobulin-like domain-containing protein n=1 Tax=unclassified Peribacillus TaxID=2675266 RepID=UPI0039A0C5D5